MSRSESQAKRHRNFYRRLDSLLTAIDHSVGLENMLTQVIEGVIAEFATAVGLESGRLYRDDGEGYVVVKSFGARGKALLGFRVSRDYAVFQSLLPGQPVYFAADDPSLDPSLEGEIGVSHFVAFLVGPARDYIASFGLSADADIREALLILNTLRYAVEHRLREGDLEGQLLEARSIQMSLLPKTSPRFDGFVLAGKSIPADEVGGDVFDFPALSHDLIGVAIGDASGHGLPAALQARDVVTGLRMGVERDLKITAVIRRLNRVIHQSGLTSRFVSLLYGELGSDGTFVYVNAGHDPGLLLRTNGEVQSLGSTGLVLGPIPDIQYRRSFAMLAPGDVLLLHTDGVVERQGPAGEYGRTRMIDCARRALASGTKISELPELLLRDTYEFGRKQPWSDDATVVVVGRDRDA